MACAAALAVALCLPVGAAARPGGLDRGFNGDGKVVTVFPDSKGGRGLITYKLPYEWAPGRIAMASARDGGLAVANSEAIVRYLPNGRRDPRFGGGGAVPIGPLEGARFQLADVAVDSQGRVLIAGTAKPTAEKGLAGQPLPGPLPTVATIRRYLPDGRLDPSFGGGGVLGTDLGAPPPTYEGKPFEGSAVAVVGMTVDGADRPVVTGSAVAEVGRCARSMDRYQASRAIVARLTVSGAPDTSFAGGLKTIGGLSWIGLPAPRGGGVFAVGSSVDPCPTGGPDEPSVAARLSADGSLNPAFGGDGLWSRPFTRISDLAIGPGGTIVLLTRTIELSRGEWVESAGAAVRLRANGSFDRGFGRRGEARVRLPKHSSLAALAVDRRGRVLLAGTVKGRPRGKRKGKGKRRAQLKFLLIRTTAGGGTDRRFGRRGRVTTAFGARANVRASDVLVDRTNRIAVGGKFSGPSSGNAFALARYVGGR